MWRWALAAVGTSVVVMAALADLGDRCRADLHRPVPSADRLWSEDIWPPATHSLVFKQLDVEKSVEDQVRISER